MSSDRIGIETFHHKEEAVHYFNGPEAQERTVEEFTHICELFDKPNPFLNKMIDKRDIRNYIHDWQHEDKDNIHFQTKQHVYHYCQRFSNDYITPKQYQQVCDLWKQVNQFIGKDEMLNEPIDCALVLKHIKIWESS